jgi:hypothetical protein
LGEKNLSREENREVEISDKEKEAKVNFLREESEI